MRDIKAIIDIGSNSIRLSLYDMFPRLPYLIFTQKELCGLAEGLDNTNMIKQQNIDYAKKTLRRFKILCQSQDLSNIIIVATSAVRDSHNGHEITDFVNALFHQNVEVLSGEDEAYFAARAIESYFFKPKGMVIDLGGGSIEFAYINDDNISARASFPYGVLRAPAQDEDIIKNDFKQYMKQYDFNHQPLYIIGGACRSLARLYIEIYHYPLHMLHELRLDTQDFLDMLDEFEKNYNNIAKQYHKIIPKKRMQKLPDTIYIMRLLIKTIKPSLLIFSAASLRDGILYDMIDEEERHITALEATANQLMYNSNFHFNSRNIIQQIKKINLSQSMMYDYEKIGSHIVTTAVYLSNIAIDSHPDYRAREAFERILSSPLIGITHRERIILALAISHRYFKTSTAADIHMPYKDLLYDGDVAQARLIGNLLRFYYFITAGMVNRLCHDCTFDIEDSYMIVSMSSDLKMLIGDDEKYYLHKIANTLGKRLKIN